MLFQSLPRLSDVPGFARIPDYELSMIRLNFPANLAEIAIANAMWRAGHPGWRETKSEDRRRVYFLQACISGLIKIGVAADPGRRSRQIATMSPEPVRLLATTPGGAAREAELHREFAAAREHGEWFRPSAGLLDYIGSLR